MYSAILLLAVSSGQALPKTGTDQAPVAINLPEVATYNALSEAVVSMDPVACVQTMRKHCGYSISSGKVSGVDKQSSVPLPSMLAFIRGNSNDAKELVASGVTFASIAAKHAPDCRFVSTPEFSVDKEMSVYNAKILSITGWNIVYHAMEEIDSLSFHGKPYLRMASHHREALLETVADAHEHMKELASGACTPKLKVVALACRSYKFHATYGKGSQTTYDKDVILKDVILPNINGSGKYFSVIVSCA